MPTPICALSLSLILQGDPEYGVFERNMLGILNQMDRPCVGWLGPDLGSLLQGEILSELSGLSCNNQLSDRICIVKEAKIRHEVE